MTTVVLVPADVHPGGTSLNSIERVIEPLVELQRQNNERLNAVQNQLVALHRQTRIIVETGAAISNRDVMLAALLLLCQVVLFWLFKWHHWLPPWRMGQVRILQLCRPVTCHCAMPDYRFPVIWLTANNDYFSQILHFYCSTDISLFVPDSCFLSDLQSFKHIYSLVATATGRGMQSSCWDRLTESKLNCLSVCKYQVIL